MLADGTNTYTYGYNRIAQISDTQTGYFLGDALGSVRQVADEIGAVNLVQSYSPYGEVISSVGDYETSFSYTGEMADGTGLVFLRARYYDPATGRFLNKDVWGGDYNNPITLNRFSYVGGNPINYTDPSGYCISGAVVDTIFCFYVISMIGGAVIDSSINAYTQYQNTGQIDLNEVFGHALEGAVIAGGPFILVIAAPEIISISGYGLWSSGQALRWEKLSTFGTKVYATSFSISNFYSSPSSLLFTRFNNIDELISSNSETELLPCFINSYFEDYSKSTISNDFTSDTIIGSTRSIGENYLQQFGGGSNVSFETEQGWRYVDQLINNMAYESKVGYVPLTNEISLQVSKDVELLATNKVTSVSWVFFRSPITGRIGPSEPLYQLLSQNGISVLFGE